MSTAKLSSEERSRIARLGGRAVDPKNRSFSRDAALAKSAGTKGGAVTAAKWAAKREAERG